MDFEKLLKKNNNLKEAPKTVADETLAGSPVVSNTSGFTEGETVLSIDQHKVVIPTIGGQEQRATVVMQAEVINKEGKKVDRLLFLSTLVRKINIDSPFKGMIASDKAFKNHEEFNNEEWVKAFKASAPFSATSMEEITRDANVRGEMRPIRVRELTLETITQKEAEKLIKD